MVGIAQATSAATAATQSANTANASKSLASNYTTFLTLLTSQLKNQDPLKPTDSGEFVQQLVSFSGVEQQIRASDQLEKLVGLQTGAAAGTAVSYLGKSVTVESATTKLADGKANWTYALSGVAVNATANVKDASGRTVYSQAIETKAGAHPFEWNGKTTGGDTLPDGNYTLSIDAKDNAGEAVTAAFSVRAVVNGVDLSGSKPLIETDKGTYALEKVLRVGT